MHLLKLIFIFIDNSVAISVLWNTLTFMIIVQGKQMTDLGIER